MQRLQETPRETPEPTTLGDQAVTTQSQPAIGLSSEEEFEEDFEILASIERSENQSVNMSHSNVEKMPSSLKVKAVLLQGQEVESSSPEVRRFSVSDVTYNGLLTSVQSAFNAASSQSKQHYTLFWKDEDCDLIQFSSTEELLLAIDYIADDTLRLYVTITRDETHDDGTYSKISDTAQHASDPPHYPHPHHWKWMGAGPPPFVMGPAVHRGRKEKLTEECRHKKMAADKGNGRNEELKEVRQQVPAEFRAWVRQYVRKWFRQGPGAAGQIDNLPDGATHQLQQWLHDFLASWHQRYTRKATSGSDEETRMEEDDDGVEEEESPDKPAAPEGVPAVYYQWLRLFLPRFCQIQMNKVCSNGSEEDRRSPAPRQRHGRCHGKHATCHGKKEEKREGCRTSSSESEDTDDGEKMWKKVPKELRKYVRTAVQKLHKNKVETSKVKEKAIQAGLSPEVVDFVPQILLEWHSKLSQKRPRAVAMEMVEAERALPPGLEREHFLWMCRFMARWHRRHAGKCDVMSGWSSGETGDDTSGEEGQGEGFGPCMRGHFRAAMRAMRDTPQGMTGPPPHLFAMYPGMGPRGGCFPPPPPGMSYWAPPCRMPRGRMSACDALGVNMMLSGPKRCCRKNKTEGCAHRKGQNDTASYYVCSHHDEARG